MDNQIFEQRTSVRSYLQKAVPEALLRQLLEAAVQAPSGGNRQPWHFYVARGEGLKKQLAAVAWQQKFVAEAPVVLVVCAEPERSAERYQQRGAELYCLQDTAAATQNILLCAAANGLGACWVGAFDEPSVSAALALPKSHRPVAMIPLGYPKGAAKKPKRRKLEEAVTFVD
ncbi:nitroreductase family protein [Ruminococcaceae bacterium OttesenSCG-928-D13]|nr:nitroreductase family protein [Ruminococcaceae bacterium OttesenSCG-928-D13]